MKKKSEADKVLERFVGKYTEKKKAHGFTDTDVAIRCGIKNSALSRRTNGKVKLTISDIYKLAEVLHFTKDDLAYIYFGRA